MLRLKSLNTTTRKKQGRGRREGEREEGKEEKTNPRDDNERADFNGEPML